MKIETVPYNQFLKEVPETGNHIIGTQRENEILIYQAFNNSIADFAIKNQSFGGDHYSFDRMSWIKPGFLWMMYRCGWAEKENQERVLGIWIKKDGFVKILEETVYSSFQDDIYLNREVWKDELNSKNVRLQWDPDHNIYGERQDRKAIQLGLKNDILTEFNQSMITEIIDLTEFVRIQKANINSEMIDSVKVPRETIYKIEPDELREKLKV